MKHILEATKLSTNPGLGKSMRMTTHAHERIAQRIDPLVHAPTLARLAYERGLGYQRFPFWLKRYVRHQNKKYGRSINKLYRDRLFLYKLNTKTGMLRLITVLPIQYAINTSLREGFITKD